MSDDGARDESGLLIERFMPFSFAARRGPAALVQAREAMPRKALVWTQRHVRRLLYRTARLRACRAAGLPVDDPVRFLRAERDTLAPIGCEPIDYIDERHSDGDASASSSGDTDLIERSRPAKRVQRVAPQRASAPAGLSIPSVVAPAPSRAFERAARRASVAEWVSRACVPGKEDAHAALADLVQRELAHARVALLRDAAFVRAARVFMCFEADSATRRREERTAALLERRAHDQLSQVLDGLAPSGKGAARLFAAVRPTLRDLARCRLLLEANDSLLLAAVPPDSGIDAHVAAAAAASPARSITVTDSDASGSSERSSDDDDDDDDEDDEHTGARSWRGRGRDGDGSSDAAESDADETSSGSSEDDSWLSHDSDEYLGLDAYLRPETRPARRSTAQRDELERRVRATVSGLYSSSSSDSDGSTASDDVSGSEGEDERILASGALPSTASASDAAAAADVDDDDDGGDGNSGGDRDEAALKAWLHPFEAAAASGCGTRSAAQHEALRLQAIQRRNERAAAAHVPLVWERARDAMFARVFDGSWDGARILNRGDYVGAGSAHCPALLHPGFVAVLQPHQADAVQFAFDALCAFDDAGTPSAADVGGGPQAFGCMLAHAPGLGKTLDTVALVHTLVCWRAARRVVNAWRTAPLAQDAAQCARAPRVCVAVPKAVLHQWREEVRRWQHLVPREHRVPVFVVDQHAKKSSRSLAQWWSAGGVLVVSHTRFCIMALGSVAATAAPMPTQFVSDPGPDLLVVDEAHLLSNEKSVMMRAFARVATRARLALTGSPVQNHLLEYHSMLSFVRPGFLLPRRLFRRLFAVPIDRWLDASDDPAAEPSRRGRDRMALLFRRLASVMHRRDGSALRGQLPPLHEAVIVCRLHERQEQLYVALVDSLQRLVDERVLTRNPIVLERCALRICNHPALLARFFRAHPTPPDARRDADAQQASDGGAPKAAHLALAPLAPLFASIYGQSSGAAPGDVLAAPRASDSCKTEVLLGLLAEFASFSPPRKCVVFTRSVPTIELLRDLIADSFPALDVLTMDGRTEADQRYRVVHRFNTSRSAFVLIMATRVGNLGLNVTGGTRLVLFDSGWNPQECDQAVHRVYRIGQSKDVFTYRLLCAGTIEERIYRGHVAKLALARGVLDNELQRLAPLKREQAFGYVRPPPPAHEPSAVDVGWMRDPALARLCSNDGIARRSVVAVREHEEDLALDAEDHERRLDLGAVVAELEAEARAARAAEAPDAAAGPADHTSGPQRASKQSRTPAAGRAGTDRRKRAGALAYRSAVADLGDTAAVDLPALFADHNPP